jgi:AbrB family transcriptional regulator, transcriptional pleiotropic regulator of transition state genes
MKNVGIVRKIDSLGRVVLPKELRDSMELPEGTPMEIYTEGETILLKKYQPACIFCGSAKSVKDFKGKKVCSRCMGDLRGENDARF